MADNFDKLVKALVENNRSQDETTDKQSSAELAAQLQEGIIVIHSTEYDIEQLSSIARFQAYDTNCYVLQGFPEERQKLLETQILHLAGICL